MKIFSQCKPVVSLAGGSQQIRSVLDITNCRRQPIIQKDALLRYRLAKRNARKPRFASLQPNAFNATKRIDVLFKQQFPRRIEHLVNVPQEIYISP
jgi:hypothetical protein